MNTGTPELSSPRRYALDVPGQHRVPIAAVELMELYILGAQPWFFHQEWDPQARWVKEDPPNQMTYALYLARRELTQGQQIEESALYWRSLRMLILASRRASELSPPSTLPLLVPQRLKPLRSQTDVWQYIADYYKSD